MNKVFVEICPACLTKGFVPYLKVKDQRASKEIFELCRCPQCGLVLTQNHPAEDDIGPYYHTDDYISHSESGTSIMDKVYYLVRNRMAAKKRKLIERYAKGKRLIDIGAGTGFFVGHMQAHGWDAKGMEPNEKAREVAFRSHGLRLLEQDALFDTAAQSTDVVSMWHVLEHVHDLDKYLNHIYRILNETGVLFVAVPNYQSLDAHFYGPDWGAWDVPRHLWHFSPKSMKAVLDRSGFEFQHHSIMPFDAFYVALLSEKYRGGGVFRMLRGLVIGLLSLIRSLWNKRKASSIIYVFTKKRSAQ